MINTYRYIGQRTVEKDGQKLAMPVNPQLILNGMGPFIQVTITHPRIIQEEFKRLGRKIPSISVKALNSGDSIRNLLNYPNKQAKTFLP